MQLPRRVTQDGRWFLAAWMLTALLLASPAHAQCLCRDQAALIRSLIPSVVNITARAEIAQTQPTVQASVVTPQGATAIEVNAGSGFIIDPSGLIVTNWHVVAGAFEILVTFSDGTHASAETVGAARVVDLAVLRVRTGHKLPAVRWGDSSAVQVGDPVLAIGNALGVGMSVSSGIVSALNRNIQDTPVDDFIQTDAAINHGNSGGPLFDAAGQVIGVNSAIISPTAANAGLGFAMPSNDVHFVIDHLMQPGSYTRPGWLGAKLQGVTLEMAEANGFTEPKGSVVADLMPDGPAQRAGLRPGDIILTVDGVAPSDDRSLLRQITIDKPGTVVTLGVWRYGQHLELKATLAGWPKMLWEQSTALPHVAAHLTVPPDLGLTVATLTDALRESDGIGPNVHGVLVTAVAPYTDAARRGVALGDVIQRVGPLTVDSPAALQDAIDHVRAEGRLFGMFLLLPKHQPVSITQFPGPKWIALAVASQ